MQVRLLGPVDVVVGGRSRPVPGPRRKAVLATLALHPGKVVTADRLIDIVWGDEAPSSAPNTLQSHISRLRRIFGDRDAIVARPPGYVLDLGTEPTDLQSAERLIRQGTRAADPVEGAGHLTNALALWRGPSIVDVSRAAWLEEQAERLERLRLAATEALVDARLNMGEHAALVVELEDLSRQHPYHERIQGQLMLALYRSGRQADALEVYQGLRRILRDQLGIDPSEELRDLQAGMLRQDPTLDLRRPVATRATAPAQLPAVTFSLAGRDAELSTLDSLLAGERDGDGGDRSAGTIAVISGIAGVGKTTLALHWARRSGLQFPDGQLYINLRGFDPTGPALDPATALYGFLVALGVPADSVPTGLHARAVLYRTMIAGRRVFVLLDNARDIDQVRPLLPGCGECMVLVTSRHRLDPLVALEGAYPLVLDTLPRAEARSLLRQRLGARRVAAEPDAVAEIVERCAGLPLALAIVAARGAIHPGFSLATLAGELRLTAEGLDGFNAGDEASDLRTVFSWSYRCLRPEAAQLFRLLGLTAGTDITAAATASLCAMPVARVASLLVELARANLVHEQTPGRYLLHDLLRVYASERVDQERTEQDRCAARLRLVDHYLHTAQAATRLVYGSWDRLDLTPPRAGVTPEKVADKAAATTWFIQERSVLLAVVGQAAQLGFAAHAWQLAHSLVSLLEQHAHWQEWAAAQRAVLVATRRAADRKGDAYAHHGLGRALSHMDHLDEALVHLERALAEFRALCIPFEEAKCHLNIGYVRDRQGLHAEARDHSRHALDLFRSSGHRNGEAVALNNLGWSLAQIGEYDAALQYCQEALDLHLAIGDRRGEAGAWDSLGDLHHHLGRHEQAAVCYGRSLDLYRAVGDRYCQALVLSHLSEVYRQMNDDRAGETRHASLRILDEIGHPDADRMREAAPAQQ